MATEDAEEISVPPAVPTGEDRLAAPKAASSFVSTFINKDTSGKKVAPKAVRRRGGAGGAARTADTSTTQTTETPVETTAAPSTALAPPIEPSVTLPTPVSTQQASLQDGSHEIQTAGIATLPPLPTPSQTIATPPPTAPIAAASQREASPKLRRAEEDVNETEPLPAAAPVTLPHPTSVGIALVDEGVEPTRPPKRRRVERPTDARAHAVSRASPGRSHPPSLPNRDVEPTQPLAMQTTEIPVEDHLSRNLETSSTVPHISPPTREPTPVSSTQAQLRTEDHGREHITEGIEVGADATESNSEPAVTAKGICQQITADQVPAEQEQTGDGSISPPREPRASTRLRNQEIDAERAPEKPRTLIRPKGRGRRRVPSTVHQDNESADQVAGNLAEQAAVDEGLMEWTPAQPPKKTRKPRKDKGQKRKSTAAPAAEGEVDLEAAAAPAEVVSDQAQPSQRRRTTRKRNTAVATADVEQTAADEETEPGEENRSARRTKAPRKRRTTSSNGGVVTADVQDGDQEQPVRRRGRQRESTPPDAENIRIDEETTVMATVAAAHFRTGKISRREKAMREINWEEVKERRRREEALGVPRLSKRSEVDEELNRAAEAYTETHQHMTGPRYEVVDGEIVVVESSAPVALDMNGEEIDAREVVEEGDLTARITTKSFLREGKRFPEQFMLPGQGTRWNRELTERFYDALQTFGTDFGMISTLFPGSTRRSIKLKFNREEKENPAGIKAALNGQRNSSWDDYLRKSGMTDDYFLDPKAIEEELQNERERMQVEIDAARAAAEEERRQRRIAGAELSEDEDVEQADGGKKKRKKREKKVVFQDESNVEILGEIGDDEDEL